MTNKRHVRHQVLLAFWQSEAVVDLAKRSGLSLSETVRVMVGYWFAIKGKGRVKYNVKGREDLNFYARKKARR